MADAVCPHCGKAVRAGDDQWRPFCSERCKLADLGAWFTDRYRIPGDDAEPREERDDQQ